MRVVFQRSDVSGPDRSCGSTLPTGSGLAAEQPFEARKAYSLCQKAEKLHIFKSVIDYCFALVVGSLAEGNNLSSEVRKLNR